MATITNAIKTLEELMIVLDHAYWESSNIDQKDRIYDIISALNKELSELAKLSIQDHGLDYESVTSEFRIARGKLSNLRKTLDDSILRSATANLLELNISSTVALSEH